MSNENTIKYEEMINRNQVELFPDRTDVDEDGVLRFCTASTVELAEAYGTPLLLFDQDQLRKNYRHMEAAFKKYYPKVQICFAYKSNNLMGIIKTFCEEGAYADVVSRGEFYKAEAAGVDPSHIVMNGNNKSDEELMNGIEKGALFNVDSFDELKSIDRFAADMGKKARVCIRVNPDISTDIIAEFSTALKKSKFGIEMDNGDAFAAFQFAKESPNCKVEGIHSHLGSQIEDSRFYIRSTEKIMDFCGRLKKELDLDLDCINMGGGFAVPFEYLDEVDDVEKFAKIIGGMLLEKAEEYGLALPTIMVEPGGSLVGNTAITLCRVGGIKDKEDRKLAALDAGGDLLLRATQGWYTYRAVCANKMNEPADGLYDLVGPLCYEGDICAHNRRMPALCKGDLIAFLDTGAYVTTLMNQYNGRLSPQVLLLDESGKISTIRKRDRLEDLVRNEIF